MNKGCEEYEGRLTYKLYCFKKPRPKINLEESSKIYFKCYI